MSNIKYTIFCLRKKFNIINWLKQNPGSTYENFVEFLLTKKVISPDREYFKNAVDLLASMSKREESFQESKELEIKVEKKVVLEKKETVPIKVEVVLPAVEEVPTENITTKPKSRRRKPKKKTEDES